MTEGEPRLLVVVCGLPGTGKSRLARRLARRLGARRLSSDELRRSLGRRGDYGREAIEAVYAEMMRAAGEALDAGESVLLDGTFSSRRYREEARRLALARSVPLRLIHLVAAEEVVLARVSRRRRLSEAGPEAYRLLSSRFDPIEGEHLELDSGEEPVERLLERALGYLGRSGAAS